MIKKFISFIMAITISAAFLSTFLIVAEAAEYSIKIEKDTYAVGEDIPVAYTGSSNPNDWIGICSGDVPQYEGNTIGVWLYVNSADQTAGADVTESGTITFSGSKFSLAPGDYAMYMMTEDGYTQVAEARFKVVEKTATEEPKPAETAVTDTEAPADNSPDENPKTSDNTYGIFFISFFAISIFCIVLKLKKA